MVNLEILFINWISSAYKKSINFPFKFYDPMTDMMDMESKVVVNLSLFFFALKISMIWSEFNTTDCQHKKESTLIKS